MDSLPTAHLFVLPWSATFMPVNDLSWPMWEVWSCFYPATLEEARDADHIIQQDKDLIEMSHKAGKPLLEDCRLVSLRRRCSGPPTTASAC